MNITLKLGKKIDKKMLEKKGFKVSNWANELLEKTTFKKQTMEVKSVPVKELGFTEWTRYDAICAKIKELGYELCPAEVGPALRMAYKDQPKGEWLRIAMEPITGSLLGLQIFGVVCDDYGQWLDGNDGYPDYLYGPDNEFVVVVPPQVSRKLDPSDLGTSGLYGLNDRVKELEEFRRRVEGVLRLG